METQKIVNLLNGSDNEYAKSATKKWYVTDSESKSELFTPQSNKVFNKINRTNMMHVLSLQEYYC